MSSSKVKKITRVLPFTVTGVSGTGPYVYTLTFGAAHYLVAGESIRIETNVYPLQINTTVVATPLTTTATISSTFPIEQFLTGNLFAFSYGTGQTGAQAPFTLPTYGSGPSMIQSYVTGTGGASYTIEGSLTEDVWTTVSTVAHTAVNNDSAFFTIAQPWPYLRVNITSIGAGTKLFISGASS